MLIRRLDCLGTGLGDVFAVLAVEHRLTLIDQVGCFELHTLVQVQVELRQLELAGYLWINAPSNLGLQVLGGLLAHLVNGHVVEHLHCALGQSLIDSDAVLLPGQILLTLLGVTLNGGKRRCGISLGQRLLA